MRKTMAFPKKGAKKAPPAKGKQPAKKGAPPAKKKAPPKGPPMMPPMGGGMMGMM